MFLPHLTVSAKSNEKSIETLENSTIKNDAERLYKKINDFLLEHKDISPEQFDDVCMNYIAKNNTVVNLLNKNDFDEKSKCSIVLYRGFSEKHPADNFKKCKVYLTDRYLLSYAGGVKLIELNDIVWVYPFITKQNGITTSKSIYVVTNNGKSNVVAVVNTWGKKNKASFEELYQDIINKVPNVLVGYSKENMEKAKEMYKK